MNILNSLRFHVIRFLSMKKCKSNKNFDLTKNMQSL